MLCCVVFGVVVFCIALYCVVFFLVLLCCAVLCRVVLSFGGLDCCLFWGCLGWIFGRFGGLGASWGVLGRSSAALGASWGVISPFLSFLTQQGATGSGDLYDLEGQKAPKREPRWQPKSEKFEDENKDEKISF